AVSRRRGSGKSSTPRPSQRTQQDVQRTFDLLNALCVRLQRAAVAHYGSDIDAFRCNIASTAYQARDLLREHPTGWWPSDPTDEELGLVTINSTAAGKGSPG